MMLAAVPRSRAAPHELVHCVASGTVKSMPADDDDDMGVLHPPSSSSDNNNYLLRLSATVSEDVDDFVLMAQATDDQCIHYCGALTTCWEGTTSTSRDARWHGAPRDDTTSSHAHNKRPCLGGIVSEDEDEEPTLQPPPRRNKRVSFYGTAAVLEYQPVRAPQLFWNEGESMELRQQRRELLQRFKQHISYQPLVPWTEEEESM